MLVKHIPIPKNKEKVETWKKKSLSHSQIASFEFNKESWYKSYVDPAIFVKTPETEFGSLIDKRLQDDPAFLPHIERFEYMQYKMRADFDGISLVGIPDNLQLVIPKKLQDFKTGRVAWTHKKAKDTGQLKMYLLLLWLTEKHRPEEFECAIIWLPTEKDENDVVSFVEPIKEQVFIVKHTMVDIMNYATYLKKIYKEMKEYVERHI